MNCDSFYQENEALEDFLDYHDSDYSRADRAIHGNDKYNIYFDILYTR